MSLCVIVYSDKCFYMGADSRLSNKINGENYAMNDNTHKIKKIHDILIFGSGSRQLIEKIWDEFEKQKDGSIEKLQSISEYWSKEYIKFRGNEYVKEHYKYSAGVLVSVLTVVALENKRPVIYNISSHDDYKIKKTYSEPNTTSVSVSGASTQEVFDYIIENANKNRFKDIKDLYLTTYSEFADNGIGGKLTVYKIDSKGITTFFKERIRDRRMIKYINENEGHCVATNATISGTINSSIVNGSIINGGQVNGAVVQNTGSLCKSKLDDSGVHIINNLGGGTSNIEKILLTTLEYDGNGIIEFTNNSNQHAEVSFTDSDLIIRSDNGISITGETTFNSDLKANTIKGNVIKNDNGDIIIESGYGSRVNVNVISGRDMLVGGDLYIGSASSNNKSLTKGVADSSYASIGHSHSNSYLKSTASQNISMQIYNGYLEIFKDGTYQGRIQIGA